MSWYDRVKLYYDNRLWSKQQVKNVVGKVISAEEYQEITGEVYESGTADKKGATT